jgi:hypothetical protein
MQCARRQQHTPPWSRRRAARRQQAGAARKVPRAHLDKRGVRRGREGGAPRRARGCAGLGSQQRCAAAAGRRRGWRPLQRQLLVFRISAAPRPSAWVVLPQAVRVALRRGVRESAGVSGLRRRRHALAGSGECRGARAARIGRHPCVLYATGPRPSPRCRARRPVARAKHARRRRGAPMLRRGERCPKRLKQLEVARGVSGGRRAAAAFARAVEVDRACGARPVQRRPAATPAERHVSRAGAGRSHFRAPRGAGGRRTRVAPRPAARVRCAGMRFAVGGRGSRSRPGRASRGLRAPDSARPTRWRLRVVLRQGGGASARVRGTGGPRPPPPGAVRRLRDLRDRPSRHPFRA